MRNRGREELDAKFSHSISGWFHKWIELENVFEGFSLIIEVTFGWGMLWWINLFPAKPPKIRQCNGILLISTNIFQMLCNRNSYVCCLYLSLQILFNWPSIQSFGIVVFSKSFGNVVFPNCSLSQSIFIMHLTMSRLSWSQILVLVVPQCNLFNYVDVHC